MWGLKYTLLPSKDKYFWKSLKPFGILSLEKNKQYLLSERHLRRKGSNIFFIFHFQLRCSGCIKFKINAEGIFI